MGLVFILLNDISQIIMFILHSVMPFFCFSCDRAHQGFGWVGEWANSRSVSLSLCEYHLNGPDASYEQYTLFLQ